MLFKRIFDILFSFLGLILLFPVFAIIAILIKLFSPGPVFFQQERIGRFGEKFKILKFRSMRTNHNGNSISIKGESRITPIGAILRKYKLDELPELWNVLRGDMSFVGPRPDVPEYAFRLSEEERLILNLRPGITGPASLKYANEEEILSMVPDPVMYYNEIIWKDKVRLNVEYCRTRSFISDTLIIFCTIFRLKWSSSDEKRI